MVRKSPTPRPPGPPQRLPTGTRKTTASQSKPPPRDNPSVRFVISGHHTLAQLGETFRAIVAELETDGITHINGGNVYLPPCDADKNPVSPAREKIPISPYPCAADKYKAP